MVKKGESLNRIAGRNEMEFGAKTAAFSPIGLDDVEEVEAEAEAPFGTGGAYGS
jgi:hypothetical protein